MGKPQGPAPIAPCTLCLKTEPLTWSHIIPRWIYRRIIQTGGKGDPPVPVQVRNGTLGFDAEQMATYLLCKQPSENACEDRLGVWEDYVSQLAYKDGAFPALATARANLIAGGTPGKEAGRLASLNVDFIARFGASVLWRGSQFRKELPSLQLGPYADELRRYLRDEAPFPKNARMLLTLMDNDEVPQLSQMLLLPGSWRHEGNHWHAFMCFGLHFDLIIGRCLSAFDNVCLVRSERCLIGDGHRQLPHLFKTAKSARPFGTFAKRMTLP